jgi:hypothetical protein
MFKKILVAYDGSEPAYNQQTKSSPAPTVSRLILS